MSTVTYLHPITDPPLLVLKVSGPASARHHMQRRIVGHPWASIMIGGAPMPHGNRASRRMMDLLFEPVFYFYGDGSKSVRAWRPKPLYHDFVKQLVQRHRNDMEALACWFKRAYMKQEQRSQ